MVIMAEHEFYPSIFNDVLAPATQGPSSSNTVGVYRITKIARELLKDIPASRLPYSNDLIELTEKVLNKGLRPHLTTWQAKYRKWYEKEQLNYTEDTPQELQRKYPHYDELVDDLIKTNMRMIEYKNLMKKTAFPEK